MHKRRRALVTGAAGGLGRAIALRLANAGFDLMLADVDDCRETIDLVPADISVEKRMCDLSDVAAVNRLADEAAKACCTILVNNAGIFPQIPLERLEIETWSRVMQINLNAPFLLARGLSETMIAEGWGRIINIVSATIDSGRASSLPYISSKMGLVGFTRGLAPVLGPHGITSNAVGPGLMRTPGTESLFGEHSTRFSDMAARRSMRRALGPADVAGLVAFLASDEAGMITGQSIFVDGGEGRS